MLWAVCIVAIEFRAVQDQVAFANMQPALEGSTRTCSTTWFVRLAQNWLVKMVFMVQDLDEGQSESRDASAYGLIKELYEMSVEIKQNLEIQGKSMRHTPQDPSDPTCQSDPLTEHKARTEYKTK